MRLLLDMNLSPSWVGFLQEEGFVGDPRASDAAIHSTRATFSVRTKRTFIGSALPAPEEIIAASGLLSPIGDCDQVRQRATLGASESTMTDPGRQDVTLNTLHEDLAGLHEDLTTGFGEMRASFTDLKAAMQAGFTDLNATMQAGFTDLKTTMQASFTDLKAGVADVKTALITGFRGLPTRESSEEMVRLLREANRQQDARFSQLDVRIREQHLETQQVLHALVEGQRVLAENQRLLTNEIRNLSADLKALVVRLDRLIRGRGDGNPAA